MYCPRLADRSDRVNPKFQSHIRFCPLFLIFSFLFNPHSLNVSFILFYLIVVMQSGCAQQ